MLKRVSETIHEQSGASIKNIYFRAIMSIFDSISDRSAYELAFKSINLRLSEEQIKAFAEEMLPELEQAQEDGFKRELRKIRTEILTLEATLTSAVTFDRAATE